MIYLVSLSSGKDSTCALIQAINIFGKKNIYPYYIDTKWEHDSVYEYLDYLEKTLNINILRLESEGMEELSERKKTMPHKLMRFCTEELKIKPARKLFKTLIDKNIKFINIVGIRKDESKARENTTLLHNVSFKLPFDKKIYSVQNLNLIFDWSSQEVFDYIKKNKIDVNPLYKKGFSRVGCFPCIYATKFDLMQMEQKYILRLRNLENSISNIIGKKARFFAPRQDKYLTGTLPIDLGCVNQFGICE